MAGEVLQICFKTVALTCLLAFQLIPTAISTAPIPADKSQLSGWFNANVKPIDARKGALPPALVTAEEGVKVIKVLKDGSGDFKTLADAIASVPSGNTKRTIVWIGAGEYKEKIKIDRSKPYITFYGAPGSTPKIVFDGTNQKYGTVDSATVIVESDYFVAVNIAFVNSSPAPDGKRVGAQALAVRISGDKAAFYNCRFIGFQDTLCDDRGLHFFKDCYIEGTVDFIFGSAKSLYLNTELRSVAKDDAAVITAQARNTDAEDTGFNFVHCTVSGTGHTLLGRAWMQRPKVVFAYADLGAVVKPEGWSDSNHPERDSTVFYGEYKNKGPGANAAQRVKYTKVLAEAEARPFLSLDYIKGDSWLLPPPTKV